MGYKYRKKAGRGFFVAMALGILLCIIFWGVTAMAAEETESDEEHLFDIEARLLPSGDRTYDVRLTIGNKGADWEGTVRVRMQIDSSNSYDPSDCVYDTAISLPQGSTKQFEVRIPAESIEYISETVNVILLDKESNIVERKKFNRLLMDDSDVLSMGILSDSYQFLTYLDMGGEYVYYGEIDLPVKLLELDQDNLADSLDSLIYLVIDDYNTGVLTDETVEAIRQWVRDGGMLIVGTGKCAEDILCGLDFLDLACIQVNEPGQGMYSADYDVVLSQLYMADLDDLLEQYYVDEERLIMVTPMGEGAVEVTPYALSDLGRLDRVAGTWEGYVWVLLQNVNNYTRIQYNYQKQKYYNDHYTLRRIFRKFGNGGSRLNLGGLKWIVVLYVIFVGPVLYLILRAMKKRDWYWIAVPVTTLAGILLVYVAGHGFEVVNTRVYSVTVENLSDRDVDDVTYLHCYDAGHKEWELQLAEGYEYTGAVFEHFYNHDINRYRNRVRKEGERISFGLNPDVGFEDCYFMAGNARKKATGSITCDIDFSAQQGVKGTVTNGTDRDFQYFAVIVGHVLLVYDGLPAGETCSLENMKYTSEQESYDDVMDAYLQGFMSEYFYDNEKGKRDIDIMAALGTGVSVAALENPHATVIVGVTENWDKTVDDDCSETSYGCLYSVQ